FWPCRLRRQNDTFLASTTTKPCRSACLATPMVALIRELITRNADLAIHTSAPTTVVTMPPGTTTTTALPTIGNAAGYSSSFMLGPPDWLKMKNAAAPAVKREDEEDWRR